MTRKTEAAKARAKVYDREYKRKRRQDPEFLENANTATREWRERTKTENPDHLRLSNKKWRAENREKARAKDLRRYARFVERYKNDPDFHEKMVAYNRNWKRQKKARQEKMRVAARARLLRAAEALARQSLLGIQRVEFQDRRAA